MHSEYLYNNDTKEFHNRVQKLALCDEPALRAHCKEVSCLLGTSSLAARVEFNEKMQHVQAIFQTMVTHLRALSQTLSSGGELFGGRDGKADFAAVCRAVTALEGQRAALVGGVAQLSLLRQALFSRVAEANGSLQFLRSARGAVEGEVQVHYTEAIEAAEAAYEDLKTLDVAICEVLEFSMTYVERLMPAFMERLRTAADFNHAGAALNRGAVRTLCNEALIALERAPNITF